MPDFRISYGTVSTLACATLNGLASSSGSVIAASSAISNTTDMWEDFEFAVTLVGHASAELIPNAAATICLYVSLDGATWSSTIAAGLATPNPNRKTVTIAGLVNGANPPVLFKLSEALPYRAYVAPPSNFGLLISQNSGQALGTGNLIQYRGIRRQTV
jgi:hypothetical protein